MAQENTSESIQPGLMDLLTGLLQRQAAARSAGIAETPVSEVEPFEAAFAPTIEPRLALDGACSALQFLAPVKERTTVTPPAAWSSIVSGTDSLPAIAYAAGNFPQLLRDLPALLRKRQMPDVARDAANSADDHDVAKWTETAVKAGRIPWALFGIGLLRLLRNFDTAARLLDRIRSEAPERWRLALSNEEAALAWHRGQPDKALAIWNSLGDEGPVIFNRGMAALFLDQKDEAQKYLKRVLEILPEESAWHHLAALYLALANM